MEQLVFVGASIFKLKDIEKVDNIKWYNRKGTIEKGTLIAEIRSDNNVIPIHSVEDYLKYSYNARIGSWLLEIKKCLRVTCRHFGN
jgi:hypothetical protein